MSDAPDTKVGEVDLANRQDRVDLRAACHDALTKNPDRIPGLAERAADYIEALDKAKDIAMSERHARNIKSCVDTYAKLVQIVQADDHLREKHERLDEGKATDAVDHYVVEMPKPRDKLE